MPTATDRGLAFIGFECDPELKAQLIQRCKQTGESISDAMRAIVTEKLGREENSNNRQRYGPLDRRAA